MSLDGAGEEKAVGRAVNLFAQGFGRQLADEFIRAPGPGQNDPLAVEHGADPVFRQGGSGQESVEGAASQVGGQDETDLAIAYHRHDHGDERLGSGDLAEVAHLRPSGGDNFAGSAPVPPVAAIDRTARRPASARGTMPPATPRQTRAAGVTTSTPAGCRAGVPPRSRSPRYCHCPDGSTSPALRGRRRG